MSGVLIGANEQLARLGEPAFARALRATGQAAPAPRDHVADHAAALAAVAAARAAGRAPTLGDVDAAVQASTSATLRSPGGAPVHVGEVLFTPLPPLPPMQHVGEPPARELTEDEENEEAEDEMEGRAARRRKLYDRRDE